MISFEFAAFVTILILSTLTIALVLDSFDSTEEKDSYYGYALKNTNIVDFNFAAVGDWACTSNTNSTVNNIINEHPQLVLGLGDFAYGHHLKCWFNLVKPIDHKMKVVMGNHEHRIYTSNTTSYESPERLKRYMNHFNLSKEFYSFNYENVHFIAMSSEIPLKQDSEQYKFVVNDLEKAVKDPNINWIVVFYHQLTYTSPTYLKSIPEIRDTYHPIFQKYGVDLIMQGHSHNYQRSYPIEYNAENSSNPFIMDNGKTNYHNPKGQIFSVVGTGGASLIHNFTGSSAPYTAVQFNAFGFLDLHVIHNGTMLVGDFHDNNGTIRDHFTITKSGSKKE